MILILTTTFRPTIRAHFRSNMERTRITNASGERDQTIPGAPGKSTTTGLPKTGISVRQIAKRLVSYIDIRSNLVNFTSLHTWSSNSGVKFWRIREPNFTLQKHHHAWLLRDTPVNFLLITEALSTTSVCGVSGQIKARMLGVRLRWMKILMLKSGAVVHLIVLWQVSTVGIAHGESNYIITSTRLPCRDADNFTLLVR